MLSLCLRLIMAFKEGKGSRSLVDVGAVAVRVHFIYKEAYRRESPSLSFRRLYLSLIRKRYPFTAKSTDRVF